MAKTANELLEGILKTVSSIDTNMKRDKKKPSSSSSSKGGNMKDAVNTAGALLKFSLVKPKTTERFLAFMKDVLQVSKDSKNGEGFKIFSDGMIGISNALPELVKGLTDLSKLRSRQVDRSLMTLKKLYTLMDEMGDGRSARKINRAIDLFHRLGKALTKIASPMRILSSFLTYLGISFVVFAAGIVAASALMKLTSPLGILGVVLGVVTTIIGAMALLSLAHRFIGKGVETIKDIGKGFMYLSAGILGFTLSLLGIAKAMGTGSGFKGIKSSLAVLAGVVILVVGMFALLGLANRFVRPGIRAIKGIGRGFVLLSLGILGFTLSLLLVASAMKAGLGFNGIMKSLLILGGIIIGIVGLFIILGFTKRFVRRGVAVTVLIGIGLLVMAYSLAVVAKTAVTISGMFTKNPVSEPPAKFLGREVSPAVRGLGIMASIFLGAAALYAILGIPAVAKLVGLGAAVSIAISGSLYILAVSVQKLVDVSSKVPADFGKTLGAMIGGVFEGLLGGISVLTDGNTGSKAFTSFVKNSAKIFAITGVLMSASVSLSMFARALTAFANLSEMRPIIGTKPNGEPIFGDKVNITNVGANISKTIHDFLIALITSTEGLTREQAGAIRKMGRALTGRRGILEAVIKFADVLKVYAEFGKKNEIGYSTYDENGNEIRESVPVDTVVTNMISAFTTFTTKLFSRSEDEFGNGEEAGISGRQRRRMARMSRALNGRNGILEPIVKFSETLQVFSKFGKNNQIPILDDEGKPSGKFLAMSDIADNIVEALTSFSDTLATKLEKGSAKDASKTLEKYDDMVDKLSKLSKSIDGLTRMSASIGELATNIGLLGENLSELNVDKLEDLSNVSAAYLAKTNSFSNSNQRIMEKSTDASTRPGYSSTGQSSSTSTSNNSYSSGSASTPQEKPVNWNEISQMIGDQVGSRVAAAIKNGQFIFEFDTTKSGGIYYWRPA